MEKYYFYPLKNLSDEILIKHVAHFLMALENVYPKSISVAKLKEIFGQDYERIVNYLRSGRSKNDHLIIRNRSGWEINNLNIERVQNFISRVIQEDAVLEQVDIQKTQMEISKRQALFNKYLLIATSLLTLISFYQIGNGLLINLGLQEWSTGTLIFMGLTILILIFILVILIFKNVMPLKD